MSTARGSYVGMIGSLAVCFFFFNDPATTEIYTLSLHDALPIFDVLSNEEKGRLQQSLGRQRLPEGALAQVKNVVRSEEHTSELQSHVNLVCRLLLEKKKKEQQLSVLLK